MCDRNRQISKSLELSGFCFQFPDVIKWCRGISACISFVISKADGSSYPLYKSHVRSLLKTLNVEKKRKKKHLTKTSLENIAHNPTLPNTFNLRYVSFWFFKNAVFYSVHFFFFLCTSLGTLNITLNSNSILGVKVKVS